MIKVNFEPEVDEVRVAEILKKIAKDPMGGWFNLPRRFDMGELVRLKEAAKKIQDESEVLVCIGIGGSYLGHRAVIEALCPKSGVRVVYAGNSLSRRELEHVLRVVGERDFSVNVISKSGTTLEPAVAFHAFKKKLIEKYGAEEAVKRIYATTDAAKGALHDEAVANGYVRFVVPDNIGGRYSVLSAVGMLPMAVAGVDIDKLLEGAAKMAAGFSEEYLAVNAAQVTENPIIKYAWMRYILGKKGYDTEVFASFEPATMYFNEWLKQLFGESGEKISKGFGRLRWCILRICILWGSLCKTGAGICLRQ